MHKAAPHPPTAGPELLNTQVSLRYVNLPWLTARQPSVGFRRRVSQDGGVLAAWHCGVMQSVYEAAGGSEGLRRLAGAWHRRVMADEIVSHAFSHGFHPEHTERLAAYWAEALGGPAAYSGAYGDETSVVRIHSGNGPHEEMDRRAIACFDQAMQDIGLDEAGSLWRVLHDYFAWATTTTMARYHESADEVPEGMSIPRWSWDGLQR
jgi:hemoglobin